MPLRLSRPSVGLIPTRPLLFDGDTIEPSVSVPTAAAARLAAIAAPEPELEPDGLRSSAYGFFVCPPRPLQPLVEWVDRKFAHSLRLVLPRITAPASRSRVDDERVLGRRGAGERQRSGGRHHAIGGGDVVLDQDRDAVQRAANTPAPALGVEPIGDGARVRVDLDHAVERRSGAIDRLDPREVLVHQRARRVLAGLHPLLQAGDGRLFQIERRRRGRLRAGGRDRPGRRDGGGAKAQTANA